MTRANSLCLGVSVVSQSLPIDPLLPDIASVLRNGNRLVLRAPPGAGKTTRVPAALLDAGLAGDKHVLVLEPRRIAARAAAEYVAGERGGDVGGEVGYRVRFEQRGGAATRLWFLTEGVLGRQLGRDPFLEQAASSCSTSSTSATCKATSRWPSCASCRRRCAPISSCW